MQPPPAESTAAAQQPVALRYVAFNLALPPFDDVHVRRAVAWALDRARLSRITGRGPPATHILSEAMEGGLLEGFEPFRTRGRHGDMSRARAEMRLSRYDTDEDGVCDAQECYGFQVGTPLAIYIKALAGTPYGLTPQGMALIRVLDGDLERLGLRPDPIEQTSFAEVCRDQFYGICVGAGWAESIDIENGLVSLMLTKAGLPIPGDVVGPVSANLSLLGAGSAYLRHAGLRHRVPPSVDDEVRVCLALDPTRRSICWGALDRKVTARIVAVVPYMFETVG